MGSQRLALQLRQEVARPLDAAFEVLALFRLRRLSGGAGRGGLFGPLFRDREKARELPGRGLAVGVPELRVAIVEIARAGDDDLEREWAPRTLLVEFADVILDPDIALAHASPSD